MSDETVYQTDCPKPRTLGEALCFLKFDPRKRLATDIECGLSKSVDKFLSSIGLTVSGDAGVLAKARELAAEAMAADTKIGVKGWPPHYESVLLAKKKAWDLVVLISQYAPATNDHPEPTAETRGDEGFVAWFSAVKTSLMPSVVLAYAAWNAARADLLSKVKKLEEFKAYVHKRLDDAGIPTHPDGPHGKEGCRIGDRLDILIDLLDASEKKLQEMFEAGADAARADLLAKVEGVRAKCQQKFDGYRHDRHNPDFNYTEGATDALDHVMQWLDGIASAFPEAGGAKEGK